MKLNSSTEVEVTPSNGNIANAMLYAVADLKRYSTIVVDPPWKIGSIKHTGRKGHKIKPMQDNYEMMTVEQIKQLPIKELANDNAYLFLWTTHTYLPECFEILKNWGFKYHLTMTWDKGRGLTHFGFHRKTEFVLFAYNGRLDIECSGKSINTLFYEYNKGHSIKPDVFYTELERKLPSPMIDIFARREREGWDVFGNEVNNSIDLERYRSNGI